MATLNGCVGAWAGCAAIAGAAMAQATLTGLGSGTDAEGVSADGVYVVGGTASGAYRWSSAGGMQPLGTVGGLSSGAFAANSDGSGVVGSLEGGVAHPFRWTVAGGTGA